MQLPAYVRRLPIILLIAVFPLALFAWRRSIPLTFFALSGDDFHRTLYSWEVTQGRLLPSDLWPPLQFWAEALLLLVYPHLLSVPYLLNLACSTLALAGMAALCRLLGLGNAATLLALLLAASMPWFIWLSISGLTEPIYILCVICAYVGVLSWRSAGRGVGLWGASIALLAAGMARFDGWGHSLAFSAGVAWLWFRSPRPRPNAWLIAAGLPWTFPVFWLGWHYQLHSDPFFFSKVTQHYFLDWMGPQPLARRLTWQLQDLWSLSSVVAPLGVLGALRLRQRPGMPLVALMWLTSLGLLVQSTVSHVITMNSPIRLVLLHALLLAPPAALMIWKIGARPGMLPALALTAALIWTRVGSVPSYQHYLAPDVQAVGSHVGALRTMGVWRPEQHLMIEVLFWDYILLTVLSNDPGSVIYDRQPILVLKPGGEHTLDDQTNPSLLALPSRQLQSALAQRNTRIVVAYSERSVANLRPFARETAHIGRFHVFVIGE